MERTVLAQMIAREEGFFRAGTIPARRHNPGDLRHAPNASHAGIGASDIGIEPNDAAGWADLERQLRLYAQRGMTLRQAIYSWAPEGDGGNDPGRYLADIIAGFDGKVSADTPLSRVLTFAVVV